MSIVISALAVFGLAVIVLIASFFVLVFVFDKMFSGSDEGLGIIWLAGVGAIICTSMTLAGGTYLAIIR